MLNDAVNKIRNVLWYIVIGVISFIALVFLPLIGTEVGLAWNVPTTTAGWIVWAVIKAIVACLNVLIFHSFMQQARLNVKNDPKYIEANEILGRVKVKNYVPRSPGKWNVEQYSKKGVTIFLFTALATIALTQAVLTFDWVSMLTYLFTIIMGLIFGIMQMKYAEEYWTEEFWKYAKLIEENSKQGDVNHDQDRRQGASEPAGAGTTKSE